MTATQNHLNPLLSYYTKTLVCCVNMIYKTSHSYCPILLFQILSNRPKEKSISSSRTSARRSGWRRKSQHSDQDRYIMTIKNRSTHFQSKADPRAAVTLRTRFVHRSCENASCQSCCYMLWFLMLLPEKYMFVVHLSSSKCHCVHSMFVLLKLIFLRHVK